MGDCGYGFEEEDLGNQHERHEWRCHAKVKGSENLDSAVGEPTNEMVLMMNEVAKRVGVVYKDGKVQQYSDEEKMCESVDVSAMMTTTMVMKTIISYRIPQAMTCTSMDELVG